MRLILQTTNNSTDADQIHFLLMMQPFQHIRAAYMYKQGKEKNWRTRGEGIYFRRDMVQTKVSGLGYMELEPVMLKDTRTDNLRILYMCTEGILNAHSSSRALDNQLQRSPAGQAFKGTTLLLFIIQGLILI